MSEQILIIEDETAIQSILSELLTDAGSCPVGHYDAEN